MAPSASEILNKNSVKWGTFGSIFRRGLRGMLYSVFLFLVAVATGFIRIIQTYLRNIAGGVGKIIANYLGGIATIIERGAMRTARNFLLPASLGFLEAMIWVFAALWVFQSILGYFGTDVFGLPGFEIIPFYGQEADGEEGQ